MPLEPDPDLGRARGLEGRLGALEAWRQALAQAVVDHGRWLEDAGLADESTRGGLQRIAARLADDRLTVVFIAEFSRGKSELINALFFARFGQRVLPSSAGRTTMCPTELRHEASRPPGIRLLPIATRAGTDTLDSLRARDDLWEEHPFDASSAASIAAELARVRETVRVPSSRADELGLGEDSGASEVEIPRWRHAIVNLPDPLLEAGLVVVDTPGLNAIGNEPELTLRLLPQADAILFVLAADTGVTRSDAAIWQEHLTAGSREGRLVVLNKIDGLWDDLRSERECDEEIAEQVRAVARTLDVDASRVYPVSAQKGLIARVRHDPALLARSRLLALEQALSGDLLARRMHLTADQIQREFEALAKASENSLLLRQRQVRSQWQELDELRGKNREVVLRTGARVRAERDAFESAVRELQTLRAICQRHSEAIRAAVSLERLRDHVRIARERMRASNFSSSLRDGMRELLSGARADFERVAAQVSELSGLSATLYQTLDREHGLVLGDPPQLSLQVHFSELDRIEGLFRARFGPLSLITTEKWELMRRFFETVAARVRELYAMAERDAAAWLLGMVAPVEGQVREQQARLRRRVDSVRRVLEASDGLKARLAELEQQRDLLERQLAACSESAARVRILLGEADRADAVAAGFVSG